MDNESLVDLIKPKRIRKIKLDHIKRSKQKLLKQKSPFLVDNLIAEGEENLCVNCFV